MPPARSRIWLGLGISVLVTDLALPIPFADAACLPSDQAPAGEAGEGGGEAGADPVLLRLPILDRMAAQIAGANELTAAGDAENADILASAAVDEGLARLERLAGGRDRALEAQLEPLAAAPGDAAARAAALQGVESALAAMPDSATAKFRIHRAMALLGLVLDAYAAAVNCDGPTDRAAYAETRALVLRARAQLDPVATSAAAREVVDDLGRLATMLPAAAPDPLPPLGEVSAMVSRALLAASDAER